MIIYVHIHYLLITKCWQVKVMHEIFMFIISCRIESECIMSFYKVYTSVQMITSRQMYTFNGYWTVHARVRKVTILLYRPDCSVNSYVVYENTELFIVYLSYLYIDIHHTCSTWPMMTSSNRNLSSVTVEFPAQRSVGSFDVFFDLRLNERLIKQSWGWWLETPSRPLWRHSNASKMH